MKDKKVDNKIHSLKNELDTLDEKIYNNKKTLKKIDELEESFAQISRNINRCTNLINKSIKNKNTNIRMDEMSSENQINFSEIVYTLDDERAQLNNDIEKLNNKKDTIDKEIKKQLDDKNNK